MDVDLAADVEVDLDGDGDAHRAAAPWTPSARTLWLYCALAISALVGACGDDDAPDDCERLQSALCERTAECVALGDAQARVRDNCLRSLNNQVVCRPPSDDQGPEFDLCLDASESMPCDYVNESYAQERLVSPLSCDTFLGPF